jgi:hypothetical protein
MDGTLPSASQGLSPTSSPTPTGVMDSSPLCITAEGLFLSKNSSFQCIVVLSAGLRNNNNEGTDLFDLESDPWKSLPATTAKSQKEDYAEEIL